MTEDLVFRKAEISDVTKLAELRQKQLLEEGAVPVADISRELTEYFETNIQNGKYVSWVAVDGEDIVAMSGMSFFQKPPYYSNLTGNIGVLSSVYTVESYRRKGIAKKLIGLAVDEARQHGCAEVQVKASGMGMYLYHDFGFQGNPHFLQYRF